MKWSLEAKVGAFTLAGLVAFGLVVAQLSNLVLFGKPGYVVHGVFPEAAGLEKGQFVRYSGVEVGRVDDIRVSGQQVDVTMRIYDDTKVPKDSLFSIESAGVMAEKYVNIVPGHPSQGYIQEGDTVQGVPSGGIDAIIRQTRTLIETSQQTLDTVNQIVGDPQMQASLRYTVANAEALSGQMLMISASVERMVNQVEMMLQRIDGDGQLSADLRHIAENIRYTTADSRYLTGKIRNATKGFSAVGQAELLYNMDKEKTAMSAAWKIGTKRGYVLFGAEDIGTDTNMNLQYATRKGPFIGRVGIVRGDPGLGIDYEQERWKIAADIYDFDEMKYRVRGEWMVRPSWRMVGQMIYPRRDAHGGTYIGINHEF